MKSLYIVALKSFENINLLFCFHTFANNLDTQSVGHRNYRFNQNSIFILFRKVIN